MAEYVTETVGQNIITYAKPSEAELAAQRKVILAAAKPKVKRCLDPAAATSIHRQAFTVELRNGLDEPVDGEVVLSVNMEETTVLVVGGTAQVEQTYGEAGEYFAEASRGDARSGEVNFKVVV